MNSIYSVLSLPIVKVVDKLEKFNSYNPALSNFSIKLELLKIYNENGLLYEFDKKLFKVLEEFFSLPGVDKYAKEYFDELGIKLTIDNDILPLLYYLLIEDEGSSWRIVLGNLSPSDVVILMKSPVMNQDLFNIFYDYFAVHNVKVAIEELNEIADEFGFERPEDKVDQFDTIFLPVVLNTHVRSLPDLANSSSRFSNLLRKQSTLNALSNKYRIRKVRSLAEFVTEYHKFDRLGVRMTNLEVLEHLIRVGDKKNLKFLDIKLKKSEARKLIELTDDEDFLKFILGHSNALALIDETSPNNLLYAAAELNDKSLNGKLYDIASTRKDYVLRNKIIKPDMKEIFAVNYRVINAYAEKIT